MLVYRALVFKVFLEHPGPAEWCPVHRTAHQNQVLGYRWLIMVKLHYKECILHGAEFILSIRYTESKTILEFMLRITYVEGQLEKK